MTKKKPTAEPMKHQDARPVWPVLKDGPLTRGSLNRLYNLPGLSMLAKGSHNLQTHDYECPAVCIEVERFVRLKRKTTRAKIRAVCWVGTTPDGKAANVRICWEYPASMTHDLESLSIMTMRLYSELTDAVYGPHRPYDPEVVKFIGGNGHQLRT